jgi:hypothetical protein
MQFKKIIKTATFSQAEELCKVKEQILTAALSDSASEVDDALISIMLYMEESPGQN